MSTKAEMYVGEVLRDYLLRKLPAKVDSLNAERFAVLKATKPGPYIVVGDLKLGADAGSEQPCGLTNGSKTATQAAAAINTAAITGIAASVDRFDRLVITATAAPTTAGSRSTVSLAACVTAGANAAFGWNDGGHVISRCALVAPDHDGVFDGSPKVIDFRATGSMQVNLGARRTTPQSPNPKEDFHNVDMAVEIQVVEPNQSDEGAREYVQQAIRAVREVILDDRSLDGQVQLTQISDVQVDLSAWRLVSETASPMMTRSRLSLRVKVFER